MLWTGPGCLYLPTQMGPLRLRLFAGKSKVRLSGWHCWLGPKQVASITPVLWWKSSLPVLALIYGDGNRADLQIHHSRGRPCTRDVAKPGLAALKMVNSSLLLWLYEGLSIKGVVPRREKLFWSQWKARGR